jgi:dTDP-4-amino-4,6-dideoxygalactose transaminase
MADAISRMHISGDGYYTKLVHGYLEEQVGCVKALMTTSCSHALDMSALLLDIASGDEIIMPSFTFVSTANAFVLRGARPIFVDIRPDTLNIDDRLIEKAITSRTKAIVVVHYAGVACEMESIMQCAERHGLAVIEDNAHGLLGAYRGKPLGSFGVFATQSFHETKNFVCGEGGALLINDHAFVERAEIVREKGTNRSHFFRGMVDKYSWVMPGSSYLPSDLLAAFLHAQLERAADIQRVRKRVWQRYQAELADWAVTHGVVQPTVPAHCDQPYHLYYLLLPTPTHRDDMIAFLRERSVSSVFHYVPLHLSTYGAELGYNPGDLPFTESCSERLLRLPMYNDMSDAETSYVIDAVSGFAV